MISMNLMKERRMLVDHFNSVFISDLPKLLFWLISENFQLLLSWFEFFGRFSDGYFLISWRSTDGVKVRRKTLIVIRKGFNDKHELDEGETYTNGSFNSVFTSDLSKLLFWVISENFQLSFSRFEFFRRFSTF